MKTFIKKITWLPIMETGWGNGYVIIPKGHPLNGKHYDDIDIDVHGGLTFSESVDNCIKNGFEDDLSEEDKGGWIVGFDCAHAFDTPENCSMEFVLEETKRLKEQLEKYKI